MKVWLAKSVAARISNAANSFHPLEVGGLLLGWRDGENRIVSEIVGPGPQALHGKTKFVPDHEWQMMHMRSAFELTDGDLDYLGDWHTHPDGLAQMSAEDRTTLRRIARKVASPIMLIAAGENISGWRYGAWLQPRPNLFVHQDPVDTSIEFYNKPSDWPCYDDGSF